MLVFLALDWAGGYLNLRKYRRTWILIKCSLGPILIFQHLNLGKTNSSPALLLCQVFSKTFQIFHKLNVILILLFLLSHSTFSCGKWNPIHLFPLTTSHSPTMGQCFFSQSFLFHKLLSIPITCCWNIHIYLNLKGKFVANFWVLSGMTERRPYSGLTCTWDQTSEGHALPMN